MNFIFKTSLAAAALLTASAAAAQPFANGDRKADLSIGVGIIDYPAGMSDKATFEQHLGMEWGVASFADKFTLGVGFTINNLYGGTYETRGYGTFDYTYTVRTYGKRYSYISEKWESINDSKEQHRKGAGEADMKVSREDVNALANIALHYSPMNKLDTYVKLGLGVGVMNWIYSDFKNMKGFESKDHNKKTENKISDYTTTYRYNDLDHVKWPSSKAKVCVALAAYLGATYYLTDNWGVNMGIGLTNSNLKTGRTGYCSSYGIFSVGATYKF